MNKPVPISTAAKAIGVSTSTLRRWEANGKLKPARTEGGQRRYDLAELRPRLPYGAPGAPDMRRSIAYARVSSRDQKADLERQKQMLELYCASHGWTFEVIADLGSGMNYQKKGLKRLLDDVLAGQVARIVLTHKDRLLRFGAELIIAICQAKDTEVVIINHGEDSTFEEELAGDVLEVMTVLSARLDGGGSHKNKQLIEGVRAVIKRCHQETQCS
jgi:predicted site-specific integrase-resolvase